MNDTLRALHKNGYAIAPAVIGPTQLASTEEALTFVPLAGVGTRNLLEFPWCRHLVDLLRQCTEVVAALPRMPVAVQCTLFDKSEEKNWLVALHQDLNIPVGERIDHPELGIWSKKEGQQFVQAPAELLEQLLAVRVHIDECSLANGPLRVVPGSHRHGRVSETEAQRLRDEVGEVTCEVGAGGALLFRPLLLHASSKAVAPRRRRVLHFLFGPEQIGYGLCWKRAV
jgi:hypothetical protein